MCWVPVLCNSNDNTYNITLVKVYRCQYKLSYLTDDIDSRMSTTTDCLCEGDQHVWNFLML